jgi:hypothetical protein
MKVVVLLGWEGRGGRIWHAEMLASFRNGSRFCGVDSSVFFLRCDTLNNFE